MIELSKINISGGTQARAELNQSVVSEYAEIYRSGAQMPAVTVFFDGSEYWLADGFHRYFGAKEAEQKEINEEIVAGTKRDAVLFSLSANAKHGLRRTNADKRRAVETLLNDAEWSKWSSNEIAKRCSVSHTFVDGARSSLATVASDKPKERIVTTKHGTVATMNTANIGKASAPEHKEWVAEYENEEAKSVPVVEPEEVVAAIPKGMVQIEQSMLDELRANLQETLDDNNSMARVFDANDKLIAALDEAKRYREQNRILESRIAGLMNEKNTAIRAAKSWQNKFQKLEKQAGLVCSTI